MYIIKNKNVKKIFIFLLTIIIITVFCACSSNNGDYKIQNNSNVLVCGTSADYAPFEFVHVDDKGKILYSGIDILVAQHIADKMHKKLNIENMSFDSLLVNLERGDCDFVISAIENTKERAASVDFSCPYYTDMSCAIVVKKNNAYKYKTFSDFYGKSIGVQTSTTAENIVRDKIKGINLISLSVVTDLMNDLEYDKVDAIVVDNTVAKEYVNKNYNMTISDVSYMLSTMHSYCIAVAKGDPKKLLPAFNKIIEQMNNDNKVQEYIKITNKLMYK